MGVIQGAASGLVQTGLGAAVAVKHLNQQKENAQITGLHSAEVLQKKLDANTEELTQATKTAGDTTQKFGKALGKVLSMHGSDKPYSVKAMEKAEIALESAWAEQEGAQKNLMQIQRHRELLRQLANKTNKLYGTNIVEDKINPELMKRAKETEIKDPNAAKGFLKVMEARKTLDANKQGGKK